MPLFRKPPQEPDAALPLTVGDAATLRRLVREAFAAHGREVTVEPDHVRDDSGAEYGLWNLGVLCGEQPQRKWPRLVSAHVANIVTPGDDIEALTEEQLVDLVHLRLLARDTGFDSGALALDETVPGVPTVLALDLPTQVGMPQARYWQQRGGVARWAEVGRRNLAALVGATDIEHHHVRQDEAEFEVLLGESFFTASLALVLDDVIRRHDGTADLSRGVLVAVPNRHQLAWRAVDSASVVPSLKGLIAFTAMGYEQGAGPLSGQVFWRHRGHWAELARMDGGQPTINLSPEFKAVMAELL